MASKKIQLLLLDLAIFIDLFGFGLILPIIPFLATDLGASEFEYGMLIAIYSLVQFIMAPIWGKISDRIGRRPVVMIGVAGFDPLMQFVHEDDLIRLIEALLSQKKGVSLM